MAVLPLEGTAPGLKPEASLGTGEGATLLVASTGGHLEQLLRLRDRLGSDALGPTEWATFDGNQSRALLRGETVHHVGYIRPRDLGAALRATPAARRLLREGNYRAVVSTGAGIALPFFAAAAARRLPRYYIESAARSLGPSLTGRLVATIPGTRLFTQYPSWAQGRWNYCGSVFDAFSPGGARSGGEGPAPRRVVVTLGTMPDFGFRRAVERLASLLPQVCAAGAEVLWQVGATDLTGLAVDGHVQISANELRAAVQGADLVIAHGGIGSALMALDAGRVPVLIPRRTAHGEHIDDHQAMICAHLAERGIAVSREADELTAADLLMAAGATVLVSSQPTMNLPSRSTYPLRRRQGGAATVMSGTAAAHRRVG